MTKDILKTDQAKAPGIVKLGPFGPYNNAVWLLHNKGKAAVVEMPPYTPGVEPEPWTSVRRATEELQLEVEFCLMSHAHFDHCQSLLDFRVAFPEAQFVAHWSQAQSRLVQRLCSERGWSSQDVFNDIYIGESKLLFLSGEPILLIHCPKHSMSDHFILFRGTAITGDWFLGDLKDCNALVAPGRKLHSIDVVQSWLHRTGYHVSRAFSGHGDCLYYDVDFLKLLQKSRVDHDAIEDV